MTTMSKVPDDHPLMIAWNEYKAGPDFENTKQWATAPKHTEGSLWAAFMAGWYKAVALQAQPAEAQAGGDADPVYSGPRTTPSAKVPEGARLWLWRHHDHFLAFTHQYPCFTPGGDPMTLGPPVGYAVFQVSHDRTRRALLAERDDLAKDAARYRWLRDPCSGAERVIFYCRGDYGRGLMSSAMLDAAIDEAMKKGEK